MEHTHVVISGASSGIGAALARTYARPGVRLSLLGRNRMRLEEIATECRVAGAISDIHVGDITDAAAMQAWLADCEQRQPVDVVIANAGIGGDQVLAGETGESLTAASRIVATNLQGVLNTVIPLLPAFVARKHGKIVMVSSLAALIAMPDAPVYAAAKAGVRVYGHGLRRVLAPHGVTVTVATPGFIDTPMSASLSAKLPFLWTADRAARHIARAAERGTRETIFPLGLALLVGFANMLPAALLDRILIAQWKRRK